MVNFLLSALSILRFNPLTSHQIERFFIATLLANSSTAKYARDVSFHCKSKRIILINI